MKGYALLPYFPVYECPANSMKQGPHWIPSNHWASYETPASYGTKISITVLPKTHYGAMSSVTQIQSLSSPYHIEISRNSVLHVRLGLCFTTIRVYIIHADKCNQQVAISRQVIGFKHIHMWPVVKSEIKELLQAAYIQDKRHDPLLNL